MLRHRHTLQRRQDGGTQDGRNGSRDTTSRRPTTALNARLARPWSQDVCRICISDRSMEPYGKDDLEQRRERIGTRFSASTARLSPFTLKALGSSRVSRFGAKIRCIGGGQESAVLARGLKRCRHITRSVTALCMVVGLQGTDTPKQPKQSDLVTVRGCLHGLTLTTTADADLGLREFQLTGSRELTKLLKQHSGYVVEITGLLKAGKDAGDARIKEKSGSQGRVYVGVGARAISPETATASPTSSLIEVRSVTNTENRCSPL